MIKYLHRKTYSLSEFSAGILIGFSCFLMTSVMPISPIYFAFLISVFLFLLKMRWINVPDDTVILYTPHILLAFYYTFNALINQIDMHLGNVMSFFALYYIFSDIFLYQINEKEKFKSVLKKYYAFNFIYFVIDFSYRIYGAISGKVTIPWLEHANPIYVFYIFKMHGVYGDSNEIGVIAVVVFSVAYFQYKYKIITIKYLVISFIFIILTFSRAAWVAAVFLVIFYNFFYKINITKKTFAISLLLLFFFIIYKVFINDGGFKARIEIFIKTLEFLKKPGFPEFIIGFGANRSVLVFDRYAHNIYSILIVEYGIIGFFLFSLVILSMILDCKRNVFYVLLSYLVVAASFTPVNLPFLYCGISIIKHTNRIFNISFKAYQIDNRRSFKMSNFGTVSIYNIKI
jgi:O-antigen ligase